jgi:predicted nuclease of predicted toxin-antitoxin system
LEQKKGCGKNIRQVFLSKEQEDETGMAETKDSDRPDKESLAGLKSKVIWAMCLNLNMHALV